MSDRRPTARALAAIAARAATDAQQEPVRARAVRVLIDTLAVAVAGSADPFCRTYLAALGRSTNGGPSSLVGQPVGVPAETATLGNALPTTVLQIDEGHRTSGTHPGIHVVPAALAVAEECDTDGQRLLAALVAGYEVAARIGLALRPLPANVHPNGTSGAFGAAVAAAMLWGADAARLESVIDAVASVPLQPRLNAVFDGSSVLYLYAALGAQLGVAVARAVSCGATCVPGAFHDYYLANSSGNADTWDQSGLELDRSYFKYYPACAHAHTSIEALESILAAHPVVADEVERIDVRGYAAATALSRPRPTSDLAARFSIPFCLARRIVVGPFDMTVLDASDLGDDATLALASRVFIHRDPEFDRGYPAGRPVRVTLHLTDGSRHEATCHLPRGDCERPETEAAWREKIAQLVRPASAGRLLRLVDTAPARWTATQVGEVLRAASHVGLDRGRGAGD